MVLKKKEEIKKIIRYLGPDLDNKIKTAQKIADIGCAEGELLKVLSRQFKKPKKSLYGFDVDPKFVSQAQKFFSNIYKGDFSLPAAPKQTFDLVFCLDVLEHIEKPNIFLANLAALMKKSGFLVLTTPNLDSFSHFLMGDRWFGFKDKTHQSFYRRSSLFRLLEKEGLKIINYKTLSCSGNSFYDRIISFLGRGGQIVLLAQKNEN